jgi:hypothetical protein
MSVFKEFTLSAQEPGKRGMPPQRARATAPPGQHRDDYITSMAENQEPSSFQVAQAEWNACRLVHDFVNGRVRPLVAHAASTRGAPDSDYFRDVLLRMLAWTHTLRKLHEPADVQAVNVASRTLFEIAVDVTILHFDQANPPAKVLAWEASSKLKAADRACEFAKKRGKPPPPHAAGYVARESASIQADRAKYWGSKHPRDRWTGRNLEQDAMAATSLFGEVDFEETYATRYNQLCWNTHGSGLAGLRGFSTTEFPALSAVAFHECARFALATAKVVLLHLGLWESLAREFEELRQRTVLVKRAAMGLLCDGPGEPPKS